MLNKGDKVEVLINDESEGWHWSIGEVLSFSSDPWEEYDYVDVKVSEKVYTVPELIHNIRKIAS